MLGDCIADLIVGSAHLACAIAKCMQFVATRQLSRQQAELTGHGRRATAALPSRGGVTAALPSNRGGATAALPSNRGGATAALPEQEE